MKRLHLRLVKRNDIDGSVSPGTFITIATDHIVCVLSDRFTEPCCDVLVSTGILYRVYESASEVTERWLP
jgi:hypothetical protein